MKKPVLFVYSMALLLAFSFAAVPAGEAAEHPGKSTVEHPGKAVSADSVKKAVKDYAAAQTVAGGGAYVVSDPVLKKEWRLTLNKIHDPVRQFQKDGRTIYFACSDFRTMDGKDVLDIDLWMEERGGKLEVSDVKIHKVNGQPRFTYEGTTLKPIK